MHGQPGEPSTHSAQTLGPGVCGVLSSSSQRVSRFVKKQNPTTSVKCNQTSCISYHIWR